MGAFSGKILNQTVMDGMSDTCPHRKNGSMNIDRRAISRKIQNDEPLKIRFKYLDEELLMVLNSIITRYLSKIDRIFLLNSVITILREVIVNALKANAKRVYFLKNNIDIKNPESYADGMDMFKKNVVGDFDLIRNDLNHSDFFVEINFEYKNEQLIVKIINNTTILPQELQRIQFRIEKAKQYNDFSDAYDEIQDDSEGAGLGLVLTVLFLKNMGINPDNFRIQSNDKVTQTSLVIPQKLQPTEITTRIKEQILEDLEGIPTFPEHILELQRLCSDQESSIELIAEKVKIDPALVTDVIKLSNSAGFVPGKRIDNINTAIMTIGLKNLNAILIASNARRILNTRFSSFEQIWSHCNQCAFYARQIALRFQMARIVENVFLSGLLHDFGKIILLSTDLNLVNKIADIMKDRRIVNSTVMEEISIGISHSVIGEIISKNWNFPVYLVDAIKYHHSPLNESGRFRDIVFTVYLANMLCGIETRKYTYFYIEETVLEHFGILDQKDFDEFHKRLKVKWEATKAF